MRPQHILQKVKGSQIPSRMIFVDTETNGIADDSNAEKQTLDFGYACYVRRMGNNKWSAPDWIRFETYQDFWKWAYCHGLKGTKLYIFSHNTSFDFTILQGFVSLRKRGWKLQSAVIESPPSILIFKRSNRSICVLDTLNYFRVSLRELGEAIGLSKLHMPSQDAPPEIWDKYCKRDVEIILEAMLFFIRIVKEWDLGCFQKTLASQAFTAYRHHFMHTDILIDSHEKALELSRKSYYGGRTECYHLGTLRGKMQLMDINSQYPYVMKSNVFPVRLLSHWNDVSMKEFDKLILKYCLCAEVELNTNQPLYPYIFDKRLIFPIGKFTAFLTTPELIEAKARGHITAIKRVAIYESANIFTEFVDYFYEKKLEFLSQGNKPLAFMTKILLNSFYGKFGQSGKKYEESGKTNSDGVNLWLELDVETGKVYKHREYAGIKQIQSNDAESYNSFPAIAAHVTAYARCYLWHLIETAGRDNVYYCDTDSLLVNNIGAERLSVYVRGQALGGLKIERHISFAHIRGAKDYVFNDVNKIKGIKKKARQISDSHFEQLQFPTFKGLLRAGNLENYVIKRVEKRLTRIYRKGIVRADGAIMPILLGNWS